MKASSNIGMRVEILLCMLTSIIVYKTDKIPLPEGYDAALCIIYYLNTENGTIEAFETKYEDVYLVF